MENLMFWFTVVGGITLGVLFLIWLCVRYIPNNQVGIVEKLWSSKGSLAEGQIVRYHVIKNDRGLQADDVSIIE